MSYNNNNAGMHTIWHFPVYEAKKENAFPYGRKKKTNVIKNQPSQKPTIPASPTIPYKNICLYDLVAINIYTITLKRSLDISTILSNIYKKFKNSQRPNGKILFYPAHIMSNVERVTIALSMLSDFLDVDFLRMVRGISAIKQLSTEAVTEYLYNLSSYTIINHYLKE